jgi:hypothetical protein
MCLAIVLAMFPRSLPRAAQRSVAAAVAAGHTYNPQDKTPISLPGLDFLQCSPCRVIYPTVIVCCRFQGYANSIDEKQSADVQHREQYFLHLWADGPVDIHAQVHGDPVLPVCFNCCAH